MAISSLTPISSPVIIHTSLTGYPHAPTEEGKIPSLDQIKRWHKENFLVCITKKPHETARGNIQYTYPPLEHTRFLTGLNLVIKSPDSEEPVTMFLCEADMLHFTSKEIVSVPLITEATKEVISLKSGQELFKVDRNKLQEAIPYFRNMTGFQESWSHEIDLSLSLSPNQLNLILKYAYGMLDLDSLSSSDIVDLFEAASFLCLEKIQRLLASKWDFIQQIASMSGSPAKLILKCKEHPSTFGNKETNPALGIQGILRVLEHADASEVTIKDLSISNLNDEDLCLLVEYLKEKKAQIERLELTGSAPFYLTDQSAPLFESLLKELPGLKTFIIKDQCIGDDSLRAIGRGLKNHTQLEILNLQRKRLQPGAFYEKQEGFSNQGFDDFAEQLIQNRTLKTLDLTGAFIELPNSREYVIENRLHKEGKYVKALSQNTSLKHLYLQGINVGDSGAEGLAIVIQNNPRLEIINLEYNLITEEGCKKLKEALTDHPSLTQLTVKHDSRSSYAAIPSINLVEERKREIEGVKRWRQEHSQKLTKFVLQLICNKNMTLTSEQNRWEVIGDKDPAGSCQYKSGLLDPQTATTLFNTIANSVSEKEKCLLFVAQSRDTMNAGKYRVIIPETLVNKLCYNVSLNNFNYYNDN